MATKVNDLTTAGLAIAYGPATTDEVLIETDGMDFLDTDGPAFAVVSIASPGNSPELGGVIESSNDAITWTAVPGGTIATETDVPLRVISFPRTGRYLRANLSIDNDANPYSLCVLLGQARKLL